MPAKPAVACPFCLGRVDRPTLSVGVGVLPAELVLSGGTASVKRPVSKRHCKVKKENQAWKCKKNHSYV